ncbi:hypothetical protein [Halobacterium sp. CBA1126]|uniref:hypothetical protein n=1 Tax=Halobacterium sp. CBA1126 TaxID=2668074 RepID=UPI0012F80722|nr:hypothetical protein [Halobacterium sp. CBA1126]
MSPDEHVEVVVDEGVEEQLGLGLRLEGGVDATAFSRSVSRRPTVVAARSSSAGGAFTVRETRSPGLYRSRY